MNTAMIRAGAYAVRLSFLGRLSKHRSAMNDAEAEVALRLSGLMSLKNIFHAATKPMMLDAAVHTAVTDDFEAAINGFIAQLAKESSRVVWARRASAEQTSYSGLVTDGRNKRLFEDMIVLCAEQQFVLALAMQAWVEAGQTILVEHGGKQAVYAKTSLSDYLSALNRDGHIHPKSSAVFKAYDKTDIRTPQEKKHA